ncbi:MAG: aspartyl protease family protein [Bryobacterales bacterium]|nr:aspartyl protease family protein [Bryobacterales bacterium]
MKPVWLLFPLLAGGLCAHPEVTLPAKRVAGSMMLTQVYLNGLGPFRMLIDTGAEASLLRPDAAARIGARAQYRVEQVTAAGAALAPAGLVTVRVGGVEDGGVETIFAPVAARGVDGVLGQSWLRRHAYLLDYRRGRVVLDGAPPAEGVRVALREAAGRPCLAAQVDGETRELVIDSGASALVLFGEPVRRGGGQRATMVTHNGTVEAGVGRAVVAIGNIRCEITAAVAPGEAGTAGLLPAAAFGAVYVAGDRRWAVLSAR